MPVRCKSCSLPVVPGLQVRITFTKCTTEKEEIYSSHSAREALTGWFFSGLISALIFRSADPFAEGAVGGRGADTAVWICLCSSDCHGMDPAALTPGSHRGPAEGLSAEALCDPHSGWTALGLQRWNLIPHQCFQTRHLSLFWSVLWGKSIFLFRNCVFSWRGRHSKPDYIFTLGESLVEYVNNKKVL